MLNAEVVVVCPCCGRAHEIKVNEEDYLAWKFDGVLIQNAMPYLPPVEREMLITGLCLDCQAEWFEPEEDDEPMVMPQSFANELMDNFYRLACYANGRMPEEPEEHEATIEYAKNAFLAVCDQWEDEMGQPWEVEAEEGE
jgi:hypothetical protein